MEIIDNPANYLVEILSLEKENFGNEAYDKTTLQKIINTNNYKILCMVENKELIGYVIFYENIDTIDIHKIFIKKNYRLQNRAKNLILQIKQNIPNKNIFVEVNEKNKNAIEFYKHLNFELIDCRKKYYGNDDALIFLLK